MQSTAWSEERVGTCENCERGVGVGQALRQNGSLFCSQDCYWSVQLDVNNSRLKKRKTRRRRRRDGTENSETPRVQNTPVKSLVPVDIDNAMFAFHAKVCKSSYSFASSRCGS